jgi:hypothetical protein
MKGSTQTGPGTKEPGQQGNVMKTWMASRIIPTRWWTVQDLMIVSLVDG